MLDARIARDVLDELIDDDRITSTNINARVSGGIVTLTGRVATDYDRWAAGEDAARVDGVLDVRNEIEVDAHEEEVLDSELSMAASIALARNGLIPLGAVEVVTLDGWVTATGNVHHHAQHEAVEHILKNVPGLRGYTNRVTVARAPEHAVAKRIKEALQRDAAATAEAIEITDEGGIVTLSGSVRSAREKQEAERAAWGAPGVTTITNDLLVTE